MHTIQPDDLRRGDVLLFHGTALYRRLIQLLDDSPYSHAGLFDGQQSIESLGEGVTGRPIQRCLAGFSRGDLAANADDVTRRIFGEFLRRSASGRPSPGSSLRSSGRTCRPRRVGSRFRRWSSTVATIT